jgi:hypothetical protein
MAWLVRASDPEAAEAILRDYLAEGDKSPAHLDWLVRTLTTAGLGHLVKP